jgi:multidrug resistance efflux pump
MSNKIFKPVSLIALLAGVAGVSMVLYAWRLPPFSSSVEMTDNAFVRGYVTMMSPQVSGYVVEVPVKDYENVKQGALLVRIDDRSYVQRVAQANATLDTQRAGLDNSRQQENSANANIASSQAEVYSANAALKQAQLAADRQDSLIKSGVGTTSTQEQAQATLDKAKAGLAQANAGLEVSRQNLQTIIVNRGSLEAAVANAEATVKLAEIDLQNTGIHAPRDGRVGEVGARLGQYVTSGTQLMALVPNDVWVIANFKETQLDGMQVGQAVTIAVDALQRKKLTGHIERFSPAAGSEFAVIKPDNATGNFVKIAQRVGVRIVIDEGQELAASLAPGLSVVVKVDKSQPPTDTKTASN